MTEISLAASVASLDLAKSRLDGSQSASVDLTQLADTIQESALALRLLQNLLSSLVLMVL